MTARVRAVVVNWNGAHLLDDCLGSLLAQDLPPGALEIVVVDNASSDDSVAVLRDRFPTVEVVENTVNRGFAGGVDAGLTNLDAPYVVLLNNDATFAPDAISRLVEALEASDGAHAGAATAHILLTEPDEQGRTLVNSTGNVLTSAGSATDRDWLAVDGSISPERRVFGFCGGAALLRTSALAEVGTFDERLFLYYEDTDLSWRLRAAGWTVRYVEGAVAEHAHAASSDPTSAIFRYHNTRNSLVVVTRHAPVSMVARSVARQAAGTLRAAVRTGWSPTTRARARGLGAWLLRLPRTLHERRTMWRRAVVPRATVAAVAVGGGATSGSAAPEA